MRGPPRIAHGILLDGCRVGRLHRHGEDHRGEDREVRVRSRRWSRSLIRGSSSSVSGSNSGESSRGWGGHPPPQRRPQRSPGTVVSVVQGHVGDGRSRGRRCAPTRSRRGPCRAAAVLDLAGLGLRGLGPDDLPARSSTIKVVGDVAGGKPLHKSYS